MNLRLDVLSQTLAVCRLSPSDPLPGWGQLGSFFSISRTPEELSIVCLRDSVPPEVRAERDWRCLKVEGPLDFGLVGILASLAGTLAEARISIFAISTFDTDYLLVREKDLEGAVSALAAAGHRIFRQE